MKLFTVTSDWINNTFNKIYNHTVTSRLLVYHTNLYFDEVYNAQFGLAVTERKYAVHRM